MMRYMIKLPAGGYAQLIPCNSDGSLRLLEMQQFVEGYIEVVSTLLDADWAEEDGADDIVLIVNEEGLLNGLPFNLGAASVVGHGPIVGDALLCMGKGDELLGFSRKAAENIIREWKL